MKQLIFKQKSGFCLTLWYVLKWHLNYLLSLRNKPLAACVFLTNRCNLSCEMCSIWRSPKKGELSKEDIIKITDSVAPGCCYFSFSGGEPLLVKDIYEMISYVSKKIPYVHMVSNGTLVTPEVAQRLGKSGLCEISLSLDGEEIFHNKLRGDADGYKKVISAIANIKQYAPGVKIVLNTVLFPGKAGQARHVLALAEKFNIYLKIQPVNRHYDFSDAPDTPKEVEFEKMDLAELRQFIDCLLKTRRVLNSRYYLKHIPAYFARKNICPLIRPKCKLPYYFLEINPHRVCSPCMFATGWEEGVSIEDYIKNDKKFTRLQKKLESCRKCDETMYVCYWEALINMPLSHFIRYNLKSLT